MTTTEVPKKDETTPNEGLLLIDMKDYLLRESPDEFLHCIKQELEAELSIRKAINGRYNEYAIKMMTLKQELKERMIVEMAKYEEELVKNKKYADKRIKKLKEDIDEDDNEDDNDEEESEEEMEVVKKPTKKGRPKKSNK